MFRCKPVTRASLSRRSRSGSAIVEFALLMPLLIVLVIFATDILLAILVKTQVQNAARAAGEFAINFGYDENGMTRAAKNAISNGTDTAITDFLIPLSTVTIAFLDSNDAVLSQAPFCGCMLNTFDNTVANPITQKSYTAVNCATTDTANICSPSTAASPVFPVPMVKIKVSVSYTPIFGRFWTFISAGTFTNYATVTAVTF